VGRRVCDEPKEKKSKASFVLKWYTCSKKINWRRTNAAAGKVLEYKGRGV